MANETTHTLFHFRHFDTSTDIPRLVQLLIEVEDVDHAGEDTSEETVKEHLGLPGHDPTKDRWVVTHPEHEEQLIGFGTVWKVPENKTANIYVCVHPAWRKHGIGSTLLQSVLTRAQELHAQDVIVSADIKNQDATNFLRKRAFSQVSAYTLMKLVASASLPQPTWPIGYTTRIYNPIHDFPLLLDMYDRAFEGLWGHWKPTEEDLRDILAEQKPETIFLVFAPSGEAVGLGRGEINEQLSARRGTRTGYLDAPGVVPEHRANGLYLPMLLHAARLVRDQEPVNIELESWGDDLHVLAQYQQVGFEIMNQQGMYRWQGQ
jgi:ribosomal protein S18 acetylase RimI-like enzyme